MSDTVGPVMRRALAVHILRGLCHTRPSGGAWLTTVDRLGIEVVSTSEEFVLPDVLGAIEQNLDEDESFVRSWDSLLSELGEDRVVPEYELHGAEGVVAAGTAATASFRDVEADRFDDVISGSVASLVYFWGPKCFACLRLAPVIREVGSTLGAQLKIYKVGLTREGDLARRLGVCTAPTLLVFREGAELLRLVGATHDSTDLLDELIRVL